MLLTILRYEDSAACQLLNKYGIMYENTRVEYEALNGINEEPRQTSFR